MSKIGVLPFGVLRLWSLIDVKTLRYEMNKAVYRDIMFAHTSSTFIFIGTKSINVLT